MKKLKKFLSAIIVFCLIFCCFSITANAAIGDHLYYEGIEGDRLNDYPETATVLYKDFTITATVEVGALDNSASWDYYVFDLLETSKVTILCASEFESLIGGLFTDLAPDGTMELIDAFSQSSTDEYFYDILQITLPAGKYYLLIGDSHIDNYYEYDYLLYFYYEDPEPTLQYVDGEWRCVVGDYFSDMTGLVKYGGKWFYVEDGYWNKSTNGLIKYSGKWFYVKNGKWDSSVNTLVKYSSKWFYIKNGKWDSSAKTLVKYNGKYLYVKGGKWSKTDAIVKYSGQKFYVKKGVAQLSFSGKAKVGGKTYKIKKGKVA